jgi:hypothetical protein
MLHASQDSSNSGTATTAAPAAACVAAGVTTKNWRENAFEKYFCTSEHTSISHIGNNDKHAHVTDRGNPHSTCSSGSTSG